MSCRFLGTHSDGFLTDQSKLEINGNRMKVIISCRCLIHAHQQQSLQCGTATFTKVSFYPPIKSNVYSGKHAYVPFEAFAPGVDLCRMARLPDDAVTNYRFTNYEVITLCSGCSNCSTDISLIYSYLQNFLRNVKVSLLVIVRGTNVISAEVESDKKLRFAFIGEDTPIALDDCQLIDGSDGDALRSFSKTSVLFVSISFIILMVISLAWLVFYYVQRFRYAHAKDRLQRRLFNAAKKALARIPTRAVRIGDKELDSDCPVCIDPYRTGDIVRSLPCRHVFHKTCVDPWLLEHRTCPMCKGDILKAFGYHVSVGRRAQTSSQVENGQGAVIGDADRLSVDVHSTGSESAFPFPSHEESRDPFTFVPSASPQVVQQVINCSTARTYSIIPLTVHSAPQSHSITEQSPNSSCGVNSNASQRVASSASSRHLPRQNPAGSRITLPGHVVNLVHVRSRSLSQAISAEERPTATFRSNTFGLGTCRVGVVASGGNVLLPENASDITVTNPGRHLARQNFGRAPKHKRVNTQLQRVLSAEGNHQRTIVSSNSVESL